jgi:phage gp29-like protein
MPSAAPVLRLADPAVREPSTRVLLDWTPAQIRAAEVLADGGDLMLAADLCETLLADDRIQGVLSARTRGLLGLPVEFEKAGDARRSGRAVKALEVGEDWWHAYPEAELGTLLDWGILLGIGLAQHVWTDRDNGRVVPRLDRYHARWLRFDWQDRGWRVAAEGGRELPVTPGDGAWVLHTPSGAHRPWVDGAWRSLSRWWLLKHYARQDFARHSEVHGLPMRVGIAPEGSTKALREELAADLGALGRDTAIALPAGFDLRMVEATARTWEMFRAQIELADLAFAIRLAGQNLTTDVSGGSLAAAKVHQIVRNDLIRCDAESLATTLHDQSLVHWAAANFGDPRLAPWPAWPTDPPEDALAAAQTRLVQAEAVTALRTAGLAVDEVLEQFGLEEDPAAMAALQAQADAELEATKNPPAPAPNAPPES